MSDIRRKLHQRLKYPISTKCYFAYAIMCLYQTTVHARHQMSSQFPCLLEHFIMIRNQCSCHHRYKYATHGHMISQCIAGNVREINIQRVILLTHEHNFVHVLFGDQLFLISIFSTNEHIVCQTERKMSVFWDDFFQLLRMVDHSTNTRVRGNFL